MDVNIMKIESLPLQKSHNPRDSKRVVEQSLDTSLYDVDGMNTSTMSKSTMQSSIYFEGSGDSDSTFLGTEASLGISVVKHRTAKEDKVGHSLFDSMAKLEKIQEVE
jgi:hypothetical protein